MVVAILRALVEVQHRLEQAQRQAGEREAKGQALQRLLLQVVEVPERVGQGWVAEQVQAVLHWL